MERLTRRIDGLEGAILASDMEEQYTAEELIDILLARLAEYEDTGYAPEEVTALAASFKEMRKEATPLIRAKVEDRLVEHPCKEGEPVWVIDFCSKLQGGYSCPYSCSAGQRERVFRKSCIPYCRIHRAEYSRNMLDRFGETVFLTKMAAQRNLEKKAEKKEDA